MFGWLSLVAGSWCWFVVREKYCWLAGGWWLMLIWCERKTLLAGWLTSQLNKAKVVMNFYLNMQYWKLSSLFSLLFEKGRFEFWLDQHGYQTLNLLRPTRPLPQTCPYFLFPITSCQISLNSLYYLLPLTSYQVKRIMICASRLRSVYQICCQV